MFGGKPPHLIDEILITHAKARAISCPECSILYYAVHRRTYVVYSRRSFPTIDHVVVDSARADRNGHGVAVLLRKGVFSR